jgi:hypothetical protein
LLHFLSNLDLLDLEGDLRDLGLRDLGLRDFGLRDFGLRDLDLEGDLRDLDLEGDLRDLGFSDGLPIIPQSPNNLFSMDFPTVPRLFTHLCVLVFNNSLNLHCFTILL